MLAALSTFSVRRTEPPDSLRATDELTNEREFGEYNEWNDVLGIG